MKSKLLFMALLVGAICTAFPQSTIIYSFIGNTYLVNPVVSIEFLSNEMVVSDEDENGTLFEEHYYVSYLEESGVHYLILKNDIDHSVHSFSLRKNKYLILANQNILFLYSSDNKEPDLFCSTKNLWESSLYSNYKVTYSSKLIEGKTVYDVSYFEHFFLGKPWVEGVLGNGISQYVQFELINTSTVDGYSVIFLNGFISYSKPYLYKENNRVKKLLLTDDNGNVLKEVECPDSSDPLYFTFNTKSKVVKYVIKEVYSGDRYDDTCITLISPLVY